MSTPAPGVRADIWLWAARFYKTRSLAKQGIASGKVEINQQSCKPARLLHAGDRVKLTRGEERFEFDVLTISDRRGTATAAQSMYREDEVSRLARESERERRRAERAGYSAPASKPDKRARRLIRLLGDIEMF
jgi:ribosome-associated heat shock protein Hsp15